MGTALALASLWGLGGAALTWLLVQRARRGRIRARLGQLGLEAASKAKKGHGFAPRLTAQALGRWLEGYRPVWALHLADLLDGTGLAGRLTATELLGWKMLGLGLVPALGLVSVLTLGVAGLASILVLAPLAWFGPDLWLLRRRQTRQQAIFRTLPTVLDLLSLSLEAGMGMDRTLRLICERLDSPMTEEFQRVLTDIELGLSRTQAFGRMAARVRMEEIRGLTRAIVQAEELGTSLVSVMQGQAHLARLTRRRHAEAEALRAPVKMIFPMVLFILPALFITLLGPVGLQLVQALSRAQP